MRVYILYSDIFPVMAIPMLLILFLATQTKLSDASCNKDSVSVPGLTVGSRIRFMYTGHDFDRVTLSVEDSIGMSLHLSMRHNFKCQGNAPKVIFNTKNNGNFVNSVHVDAPELRSGLWWTVTAQITGWLIEQEDVGFSHTYNYYFQPSGLTGITLNPVNACGVDDTEFDGEIQFEQLLPQFSKLTIQASCISSLDESMISFGRILPTSSAHAMAQILQSEDRLYVRNVKTDHEFFRPYPGPVTEDTTLTVVLQPFFEGNMFQIKATFGAGKKVKVVVGFVGIGWFVRIVRFSNIQMIKIDK